MGNWTAEAAREAKRVMGCAAAGISEEDEWAPLGIQDGARRTAQCPKTEWGSMMMPLLNGEIGRLELPRRGARPILFKGIDMQAMGKKPPNVDVKREGN